MDNFPYYRPKPWYGPFDYDPRSDVPDEVARRWNEIVAWNNEYHRRLRQRWPVTRWMIWLFLDDNEMLPDLERPKK